MKKFEAIPEAQSGYNAFKVDCCGTSVCSKYLRNNFNKFTNCKCKNHFECLQRGHPYKCRDCKKNFTPQDMEKIIGLEKRQQRLNRESKLIEGKLVPENDLSVLVRPREVCITAQEAKRRGLTLEDAKAFGITITNDNSCNVMFGKSNSIKKYFFHLRIIKKFNF